MDVWYFRISLHLDSGSQLAMVSYVFHISGFQGQGCLGVMLRVRFQISRVPGFRVRGAALVSCSGLCSRFPGSRFPGFRGSCCGVMSWSGLGSRFPGFRVRGAPQLPRLGHCWAPASTLLFTGFRRNIARGTPDPGYRVYNLNHFPD